ncbi:MAG: efflux RND transporter periplasmic adaptor subunit [Gammaproteobacteria bacterium]
MKRSAFLSLGLAVAVGIWMFSGALNGSARLKAPVAEIKAVQPMKVSVMDLNVDRVTREIVVQGQLEPKRSVQLRAQTGGRVVALPVAKGSRVKAGELLVQLAEEDRRAQIARAQAEMTSQRLQVAGHRKLKQQGLQAETQLKSAEAALAAVSAELERLRLDLAHTRITAPFDGVLETRQVEIGSFVDRGDKVAELVENSELLAVGQIPQQSAAWLELGQSVTVRFLDGREAQGEITYVASVAEPATRSFRIEATVSNAAGAFPAGVSAELHIAVAEEPAHFLSPAALTLDDQGRVGIKAVEKGNAVVFHPVTLVRTETNGVWVAGLPESVRVIVQGQSFVVPGEIVEPIAEAKL